MDKEVIFKAKRLDNGDWVEGFFTKKKIGVLIVPVIEIYRESDSDDYIESIEIDGTTIKHAYSTAPLQPNDKEVEAWFDYNIGEGCSASSAIYKFRLWLKDRELENKN